MEFTLADMMRPEWWDGARMFGAFCVVVILVQLVRER